MTASKPKIRRFYKTVTAEQTAGGFAILLDGRHARTLAGRQLVAPTKPLADAILEEWEKQNEQIDTQSMPITALASTVIDGGSGGSAQWRNDIIGYLGTDLLCYRAPAPASLCEQQSESWDKYLDWFNSVFRVRLILTDSISAIDQPRETIAGVKSVLNAQQPHLLFALRTATAITGSAVLALALWRDAFPPEEIFAASRLDEHFQQQKWGEDAEAKARETKMREEFLALARFFRLADGAD